MLCSRPSFPRKRESRSPLDGNDPRTILRAAERLGAGDIVAFPTETVYGLGANALNERAVAKVFAAKNRPEFDPLIVHIGDKDAASPYVTALDPRARQLMDAFWPGALTLVLPKRSSIPDLVTAGLGTVALRMPSHPVALALLRAVDFPIAAPSANPFGYVSPTTAAHVRDSLGDAVDLIIDGGPCQVGVESTVCALTEHQAVLLRPGGVTLEQIESVIGPVRLGEPTQTDRRSPGTLLSHYAPRVPVLLLKPGAALPQPEAGERLGLLSLTPRSDARGYTRTEALSQDGNLLDAAAHLFAALRRLDATSGLDRVVIESVPETGMGRAIMDRLRRAAARG